jgi:hypothetical protein
VITYPRFQDSNVILPFLLPGSPSDNWKRWKILYRLYVRSVNSNHRMLITVIVMPCSSYCKTSQSTRPTNYNGSTKPAPSARTILSIKCSEISSTQSATWLKGLAKPKRNVKSFAQWMPHSQRVMFWNPSEGCTPTHVSRRKAEIDCGPSTASIVAWADGWRLALLEQYFQGKFPWFYILAWSQQ